MASKLNELLERVKAATGPDKILDRDILCVIDGWVYEKRGRDRQPWMYGPKGERRDPPGVGVFGAPRCSASIDAALALTERLLPGWMVVNLCEWEADVLRARGPWQCILKKLGTQDDMQAPKGRGDHAPTAPLAIIAALLSALIAQPQP